MPPLAGGKLESKEASSLINSCMTTWSLATRKFMWKYKKTQLHNYTFKVIDALKKWKVVPIAAEFAIVDYVLRYATSIDMIAVCKGTRSGDGSRQDDTVILIEVKTGYGAGRFEAGQHSMRLPPKVLSAMFPDMMNDAPVNQAILQVLGKAHAQA
jgi:hypothetical protein